LKGFSFVFIEINTLPSGDRFGSCLQAYFFQSSCRCTVIIYTVTNPGLRQITEYHLFEKQFVKHDYANFVRH